MKQYLYECKQKIEEMMTKIEHETNKKINEMSKKMELKTNEKIDEISKKMDVMSKQIKILLLYVFGDFYENYNVFGC
jgi:cell division protein FtsL